MRYKVAREAEPAFKLLIVATLISVGLWFLSGYLPLIGTNPGDPEIRRHGALDAVAGASGVVAEAGRRGMPSPLTAKKVFGSARRGDRVAKLTVADEARWIALAIAAVVSVVDPELVILGGGIGVNGDLLLEPVERELARVSPFRPRIEVSALREDATLNGAVWMALQAAQDRLFDRREVSA